MAVPSDPTVASVVTEALKAAGRTKPSATEITDATDNQFQHVKADIQLLAKRHRLLRTNAVTATVKGQSRYTQPSDVHELESVHFIDPNNNTGWRGTAQAGTANTITLQADFDEETENVQGKWIFTTGGTGPNQVKQVVDHVQATDVSTVESNWTVTPDSTTTYVLGASHILIWREDKRTEWDFRIAPYVLGKPEGGAYVAQELWLSHVPDNIYPLWWHYWADLSRLDETGALFITFLREYVSVFFQLLVTKLDQRYDDDRYQLELQAASFYLTGMGTESSSVRQTDYQDV